MKAILADPSPAVASSDVGAGGKILMVPEEAADRFPAASTEYVLYVPDAKPVAAKFVSLLAVEIVALFQAVSAAPVMLARFVTVIALLTKYMVPVSEL